MNDSSDFDTLAVRAGIHRTAFGEHAEPMFLTSSFVFANAAQACVLALYQPHGAGILRAVGRP
jgi:O-acetylhomoserine/O-acetylserine sulfhydrylase-like pyridoxal-dependent enzyme